MTVTSQAIWAVLGPALLVMWTRQRRPDPRLALTSSALVLLAFASIIAAGWKPAVAP
jgi:hypothetical protein